MTETASGPRAVEVDAERLRIRRGPGPHVAVAGEIDLGTTPQLDRVLAGISVDPKTAMVIDLQHVTVLQSHGVAALFVQAERAPLTLIVRAGSAVATVLAICGMEGQARVEPRPA